MSCLCEADDAGGSWVAQGIRPMDKRCVVCGAVFQAPPSSNKVTCSPACRSIRAANAARTSKRKWSQEARARRAQSPDVLEAMSAIRPQAFAAAAALPAGQRGPQNRESKVWVLIQPDGQRITVINLLDWARKNYRLFEPNTTDPDAAANRIFHGIQAIASSMRGVKSRQRPVSTYKGWGLDSLPSDKELFMANKQRIACLQEVQNYTNRDAFISDLAMSSILGMSEGNVPHELLEGLGMLYDAVNRNIKEIASAAGLSQRGLAERFAIPYRTVEDWATGRLECPMYVKLMMQEILGLLRE